MSGGGANGMDVDDALDYLALPGGLDRLFSSLQGAQSHPQSVPPSTNRLSLTRTSTLSNSELSVWTSEDGQSGGESPGLKDGGGTRRRLTKQEADEMERIFQAEPNGIPAETRARLAREFGVPHSQIASWFHNRRTRARARQMKDDFDAMKRRLDEAYLENQQLRHELEALKAEHALCEKAPNSAPNPSPSAAARGSRGRPMGANPAGAPSEPTGDFPTTKRGGKRRSPEPLIIPKRENVTPPRSFSTGHLAALPGVRTDAFSGDVTGEDWHTQNFQEYVHGRTYGEGFQTRAYVSRFARSLLSPSSVPPTPISAVSPPSSTSLGVENAPPVVSLLSPMPPAIGNPHGQQPRDLPTGLSVPYPNLAAASGARRLSGDVTLDEAFREVFTGGGVTMANPAAAFSGSGRRPEPEPIGFAEHIVPGAGFVGLFGSAPTPPGVWFRATGTESSTERETDSSMPSGSMPGRNFAPGRHGGTGR